MVGMPGFLTRILAGFLTRVFETEHTVYRSTGTEKYSFTQGQKNIGLHHYRDRKVQFYSTTGTEKNGGEKPCLENPILSNIPYIKNLAVGNC